MNYISAYCHISSKQCLVNSKEIGSFNTDSTDDFIKELYASLDIKYSKFHKMDKLSKIAFIGSEWIKKALPEINNYKDDEIALIFANNESSATTDIEFQHSYQNDAMPSPALFVYTLPNILIGEISIRNKWFGESMFTVMSDFDEKYFTDYCNILLQKKAKTALCGWINVANGKIEAFLFLVTKTDLKQLNLQLESENLLKLYKQVKF